MIGDCVSRMTEAVETYGGVVRSFMGDGIAAFFGLEGAREDDPLRACLAGMRIIEVVESYAEEIEATWDLKGFAVRVGVNSGWVGTGLVGAANPEHVALGDPVNIAARLQSTAEPASVVVGASIAARIVGQFELERVGPTGVRGRRQDVDAWRVLSYQGRPPPSARGSFVGRSRELEMLQRGMEELELGRGQIVMLTGEAGIGKTRLGSEIQERRGGRWLAARCSDDHVPEAYGPFKDVLKSWLGLERDAPGVIARVRLLSRFSDLGLEDRSDVLPYIGSLLDIRLGRESDQRLRRHSAEALGSAIRMAYTEWLRALAVEEPVVLWLDDLERCDESSATLLEEVFELTEEVPLMLLAGLRPVRESAGWRARLVALDKHAHRSTELMLDALAESDANQLIDALDTESRINVSARRALSDRADGNPFYLEELLRAFLEREGGNAAVGAKQTIDLPPAIEGVLLARIDRLRRETRRLLQVAAVCGRRFSRSVVGEASGATDLEESLKELVRDGLVLEDGRVPDQHYVFRHALYQEAAKATLPPDRLSGIHERVAKALEVRDPEQSLESIATHYAASGATEKAVEYLERAGSRAARLSSLKEALSLFDRAAGMSKLVRSQWRLGCRAAECATSLSDYEEAVRRWSRLLDSADGNEDRAEALLGLARARHALRQSDDVEQICKKALALSQGVETRTALLMLQATVCMRRDNLSEARELLGEIDELGELDSPALEHERASLWTAFAVQTGNLSGARRWTEVALRCALATDDFGLVLRAKRDLGIIHLVQGELGLAQAVLAETLAEAVETGYRLRAQEAVSNLVAARLLCGNLLEGEELAVKAMDWVESPVWRTALEFNLGSIKLELGDGESARALLRECMEMGGAEMEAVLIGQFATLSMASIHLDDLDSESAQALAVKAFHGACESSGRLDLEVRARARLAEVALREGKHQDALEHAKAAVELTDRCDRTESPLAWRMLGRAEMALGLPEARATLERALGLAREMGMRLDEARALMALGLLDAEPDGEKFNQAREIFAECGAKRGLGQLDDAICRLAS